MDKLEPLPGDIDMSEGALRVGGAASGSDVAKAYVDRSIADAITATIRAADIVMPLDGVTIQTLKPTPDHLLLHPCGIQIDLETGEVMIPDGLPLTEAARAFWAAVQHVAGYRAPGFW